MRHNIVYKKITRLNGRCLLLFSCWLAGYVIGYILWSKSLLSFDPFLYLQSTTAVGIFISVILPLSLTFLAFSTNKLGILYFLSFSKAFAFGYSGLLIASYFQSASWLFVYLFLFSDFSLSFALLCLWFHHLITVDSGVRDISLCYILCILLVAADYYIISPFLLRFV